MTPPPSEQTPSLRLQNVRNKCVTHKDNINKFFHSNLFCVSVYASWLFPNMLYLALNFDHHDEYLKAIKKETCSLSCFY